MKNILFKFGLTIFISFVFSFSLTKNASSQWISTNGPILNDTFHLASTGDQLFAASYSHVFYSINNGDAWTDITNGLTGQIINCIAAKESNIFVGTEHGVFHSTNNGVSWTSTGLPDQIFDCLAVKEDKIYAGSAELFLSTNNGQNWSIVNNDFTFLAGANKILLNGNNIYVGSFFELYISTDSGLNWAPTINFSITWLINDIAVIDGTIFIATDNGIYRTTNNGQNWVQANNGFAISNRIRSLNVLGTNIFAGTDYGVYLSTNNGSLWIPKDEGFGSNKQISSLLIANNYIFAGIFTNKVWRRAISDITEIRNFSSQIPDRFYLSQNYPNPFNPSTKINFALPVRSFVMLNIYNSAGKQEAELVSKELSAGSYEYEFNASMLSSGIYFYKLETGSFSQTKKMMLVK